LTLSFVFVFVYMQCKCHCFPCNALSPCISHALSR